MPERLTLFATCSRGTERLVVDELTELGAHRVRQDRGGVRFAANLREALRICLWSRIAMRVLYPLGQFEVSGAKGLYDAARSVQWENFFSTDVTFAVEAVLKESEHTHSGFVALKLKDALVDRLREKLGSRPDVDTRDPDIRVVAHLAKQHLSLSLDVCGQPLFQRGYRAEPTEAPLKETLAAAILRIAGYKGAEPLLDPMCGSGTILLEGALIAKRQAPAFFRPFAIEKWKDEGRQASTILRELREEAKSQEARQLPDLTGIDKSEEAIEAARKNAKKARLASAIRLAVGDATQPIELPGLAPGLLVTNPPYGHRLEGGSQKGMKSFYFKLGESLGRLRQWRCFILCANPVFESAFHHRPKSVRPLWNGPLECRLFEYQM